MPPPPLTPRAPCGMREPIIPWPLGAALCPHIVDGGLGWMVD